MININPDPKFLSLLSAIKKLGPQLLNDNEWDDVINSRNLFSLEQCCLQYQLFNKLRKKLHVQRAAEEKILAEKNFLQAWFSKTRADKRRNYFLKLVEQANLALEKNQCAIVTAVVKNLKRKKYCRPEKVKPKQPAIPKYKWLAFGIMYSAGIITAMMDGFLAVVTIFATTVLTLVSNIVIALFSGLFIYVNAKSYHGIEGPNLRKELGIRSNESIQPMVQLYLAQIAAGVQLNDCLLVRDYKFSPGEYAAYAKAAILFNQALVEKNAQMQRYQESKKVTICRWGFGLIGAGIMGGCSYFSITQAVSYAFVVMAIASPPAWIAVLVMAVALTVATLTALGYLYATQKLGLFDMFNPRARAVNKTKIDLEKYHERYADLEVDVIGKMQMKGAQVADKKERPFTVGKVVKAEATLTKSKSFNSFFNGKDSTIPSLRSTLITSHSFNK